MAGSADTAIIAATWALLASAPLLAHDAPQHAGHGPRFDATKAFIDVGIGGDLGGMIAFCRAVLDRIDADAVIVPGHGTVAGRGVSE